MFHFAIVSRKKATSLLIAATMVVASSIPVVAAEPPKALPRQEAPWSKLLEFKLPQSFHPYGYGSMLFSPDRKYLAMAGMEAVNVANQEGVVLLFRVETGKLQKRWNLGPNLQIERIKFDKDVKFLGVAARMLALVDRQGRPTTSLMFLDVDKGRVRKEMQKPLPPDIMGISTTVNWDISPDGKLLAVADGKVGMVRIYDFPTLKAQVVLKSADAVTCVAFSPDSRTIATAHQDRLAPGPVQFQPPGFAGGPLPPNGKVIKLWEASSGKLVGDLKGVVPQMPALVFSADGKTITAYYQAGSIGAVGPKQCFVNSWDVSSRKEVDLLPKEVRPSMKMMMSADGKSAITVENDPRGEGLRGFGGGPVVLNGSGWQAHSWNLETKKKQQSFEKLGETIDTVNVDLSADGKFLAFCRRNSLVGSPAGSVQIWSWANTKSPREPTSPGESQSPDRRKK